ncbi:MAG TPA: isoaspartyl peptidase/L-asparaginase, partial [Thermoanaerobaculia bacterium]|nr:isoaspartyl peptidase/L-asparaginase [Thermoanaerobaculia bacterium]
MKTKTMRVFVAGLIAAVMSMPAFSQTLVVHGGAGTITRGSMTPEREKEYRSALEAALRAGHAILARGGSSLDAVEAAIRVLEDNPLFNAGK